MSVCSCKASCCSMAARVRPVSNTRQLAEGPKDQNRWAQLSQELKSPERTPAEPSDREPGEQIGRDDADARRGRMNVGLGLADVRPSAQQIRWHAGRHRRRRGRDGGCGCQLGNQVGRLVTQQDADRVDRLPGRRLQSRDHGGGGRHLGVGVGDVQAAHEPAFEPLAGQPGALLLRGQVLPCDVDPLLKGAQFDVIARHLGRQRHQHIPATLDGGLQIGIGGLDAASDAAEDVQLPAGVEAGIVGVGHHSAGFPASPAGAQSGFRLRRKAPVASTVGPSPLAAIPTAARAWRMRASASFKSRLDRTARSSSEVRVGSSKTVHHRARSMSACSGAGPGAGPAQRSETATCGGWKFGPTMQP